MRGVDIVVIRHVPTENTDAMGETICEPMREVVHDVLWSPHSSADLPEADRPDGDIDAIKLHFPKTYEDSLAGCDVEVDGAVYRVQGDPRGYLPHLTPGRWNRPVVAKRVVG